MKKKSPKIYVQNFLKVLADLATLQREAPYRLYKAQRI